LLASAPAGAQIAPPPFDAPAPAAEPPTATPRPPAAGLEGAPAVEPPVEPSIAPQRPAAPPPVTPPVAPVAAAPSPAVTVAAAGFESTPPRREDPQADRVLLLPTATTHAKGSVFLTSYDLVFLQAGYAFTDATQLSFTTVPATPEGILILDLSLKTSLYRGGLVRAAAIGSASGAASKEFGVLLVGRAGGVVQLCFTAGCESSFSISSNVALAGPVLAMFNGLGVIYRAGRSVSLLGELSSLIPVGKVGGEFSGSLLGGGLRFHLEHWGFDVTVVRQLGESKAILPVLTATYRS